MRVAADDKLAHVPEHGPANPQIVLEHADRLNDLAEVTQGSRCAPDRPVATVLEGCVGCGPCGENAHEATLCPVKAQPVVWPQKSATIPPRSSDGRAPPPPRIHHE
jgi:hypothetical protein